VRRRQALAALAAFGAGAAARARPALPPVVPVQVGEHAWYVQGLSALGSPANANFVSNAGFVVTDASVVVIDALGSPALAQELRRQIARITARPVSHVVLTHYHADHVYGLQAFKEAGAVVVAHRHGQAYLGAETARLRLAASRQDLAPWIDGDTRLVPADRWIDGPSDLVVGGVRLQLRPAGPAHTPDDTVVYLPDDRVLYTGDLVFRGRVPFVGQADSRRWLAALDMLLAFDARVLVPGHGAPSREPRRDLQLTRDYIAFLREAMGEAARNLEPFDEAYARTDWSRFQGLPLFDAANRINAYNTYLLMEQER
jgi:glyoxylase-like metal-dependent hydrolase (beta-lactamase superfamily II)